MVKETIFKFDPTSDWSELDDLMHNGVNGTWRHHHDDLCGLALQVTKWRRNAPVNTSTIARANTGDAQEKHNEEDSAHIILKQNLK